jgi:hypothetical protein
MRQNEWIVPTGLSVTDVMAIDSKAQKLFKVVINDSNRVFNLSQINSI